jgi:hypothetical protein
MKCTLESVMYGTVIATACIVTAVILLRPPANVIPNQPYKVGEAVGPLNTINYADSSRTLLLVVQSSCQYCTASMPFYRKLEELSQARRDVRIFVVTQDTDIVARKYLDEHKLNLPVVPSINVGNQLNVTGTPTLLLVDRSGKAKGVWVGLLSSSRQSEILQSLLDS